MPERPAPRTTLTIRSAGSDDALSLAELHVRSWQEAYAGQLPQTYLDTLSVEGRIDMWRRLLSDDWPADTFVAVTADEVVAFISVDSSADANAGSSDFSGE